MGRLTRQELGWLLTQEAQGAADRLRQGVQVLKSKPPAPLEEGEGAHVDDSLAALDDAMKMLSSLHNRPISVRGRRGRIDLASLLWELAPDAQISIEPGSGTEVFGDEAELRRMMSLLIGHGSGTGSSVAVKREGDEVRITVALGPDSTASFETERAWLSRMAIRYGGRYELEGGMEIVALPADAERKEREQLERELDEARKQGEAYARELAASFSTEGESASPSTFPPALSGPEASDRFVVVSRLAGGVAAELRAMLSPLAQLREPEARAGEEKALAMQVGVKKALQQAQEFVGLLSALGELDPKEPAGPTDLGELAAAQIERLRARAERQGVSVELARPSEKTVARVALRQGGVLVHHLVAQAISASPRGSVVKVTVQNKEDGSAAITVDDAGAPLPVAARKGFLRLELEPGTYGRPSSIPLYLASEIAACQGASLELADSENGGGVRVRVTFAR